jgi:alkanesulfonate monooxygenase SsuD/methylene tetrahydromethanopterin reductase-like flavin-dependent oxidoreductase (luciferase family)
MEFGLFFINEKPPGHTDQQVIRDALEQSRLADELGFDCLWLGEHHFAPYGTMSDTMVFGAAVAQATERIPIGTACIVPSFSHPVRVAEQIAMLDVISDGRFRVGLGRGYQQREFRGYGVPQEQSKARFREATKIIDGLLSTENFSYDGEFWQVNDLTLAPRPVQKPRPPIYIAASVTPESFEWLVENDYRALAGNPYTVDPGVSERSCDMLMRIQEEQGKPRSLEHAWGLVHNVLVAETDKKAADIFRPNWDIATEYLLHYARALEDDSDELPEDYKYYAGWLDWLEGMEYDDMLKMDACLIGSPSLVAEKLAGMHEKGTFWKLILWMNRGGAVPQRDILRSMEMFGTEVMPQVRDLGPQPLSGVAGS